VPYAITDRAAAAQALATVARGLYHRGWLDGTAGNLSIRLDEEHALITASGRSKGELSADDVVLVRISDATAVEPGAPRPSAETSIHAAIYRTTDAGAVVHAHPPYATVVSARAAREAATAVGFRDFEIIKGFGIPHPDAVAVPLFENWPDVARIATDVQDRLSTPDADRPPALLIGYHGVTAWAPDLAAARDRVECLEALCRLHLLDSHHRDRDTEWETVR
jgi:methylthioribulose-1-phosphate dehydratase